MSVKSNLVTAGSNLSNDAWRKAKKIGQVISVWWQSRLKPFLLVTKNRVSSFIVTYPFSAFLLFLAVLIGSIAAGNALAKSPVEPEVVLEPKVVDMFMVGGSPELRLQAKIEKSGVIKLVAQTPGVVQKIRVSEGQTVKRGAPLFTFSSTYQGGNLPAVARLLEQKNVQFTADTFQAQLDSIGKNREIAQKAETQQSELREINRKSVDDTKGLISLNEEIISTLDKQIKALEAINVNGASDSAILALKVSKSQSFGALSGLRSALRSTEYLNSDSQEPAEIARLSRDSTLKQLEIQEKSLQLNKDVAQLKLKIAKINESLMYPASPCPGVVERIHVKVGQVVAPGTVLASIKTVDQAATAVVLVSGQVAKNVSPFLPSYLLVNDKKISVEPRYISQEPTDGNLHSILYSIPASLSNQFSNDGYVDMIIPVGPAQANDGTKIYLPLDAVYQNQDASFVYTAVKNPAGELIVETKQLKLGKVLGTFVEVREGLGQQDMVILNRSVVPGEKVKPAEVASVE